MSNRNELRTDGGGSVKLVKGGASDGKGDAIVVTRGYKETSWDRLERIRSGNRARVIDPKRVRGGRRGERSRAIQESQRD